MKGLSLVFSVLCAVRAAAAPVVAAADYPGAYFRMTELSLAADPLYGSRFLDSFELHLRSIAAMTSPRAVADYLEMSVVGAVGWSAKTLSSSLGQEPMEPHRAAALLLAHALARPEQFPAMLEGLEARKAGLGRHVEKLMRETRGPGSWRLTAVAPLSERLGQLEPVFDGGLFDGRGVVEPPKPAPRLSGFQPERE